MPSLRLENVGGDEKISPPRLKLVIVGSLTGEVFKQALSTDNLVAIINYTPQLTPQVKNLIRPVADELNTALIAVIDAWVDQGYIDLAELSSQLRPLFQRFLYLIEKHS